MALEAASLVQWLRLHKSLPLDGAVVATSSLALVAALVLLLLSQIEHVRSVKPSSLIIVYLVFSIFFDAVRCRTLWLLDISPLTTTFTATIGAKILVLCVENRNKRSILKQNWKDLGQEATSSVLNTTFLWWVNPVLWTGHTSRLRISELPALEPQFRAESLLPIMLQNWEKYKDSGKYALIWTLIGTTKPAIIASAVPRILLSGCRLVMPFFVARIISYVSGYNESSDDRLEVGYSLIAATALLFFSRAVVDLAYEQAKTRMEVMMRSALVATILHSASQLEPGEKNGPASLTLITADASRAVSAFNTIHELWITPVEIVLATWLLARQLGIGSVGPIITVVGMLYRLYHSLGAFLV